MDSLRKFVFTAALVASVSLLAGCVTDPAPKKPAVDDPAAKKTAADDDSLTRQARQLRGSSPDDRGTGVSDKSRSIENDLGYH